MLTSVLSLTLRFFASKHSFNDLEAGFKTHRTTISDIVIEICNAIYDCLKEEYLKISQTKEDRKCIAEKTQERRQFPNGIRELSGKNQRWRCFSKFSLQQSIRKG